MAQYCILGKRINKLSIPKTYDINKIQLGVVVIENEAKKVGLAEVVIQCYPREDLEFIVEKMLMDVHTQIKQNLKNAVMFQQIGFIHLAIPMLQRLRLMYIRNAILKLKLQHME